MIDVLQMRPALEHRGIVQPNSEGNVGSTAIITRLALRQPGAKAAHAD